MTERPRCLWCKKLLLWERTRFAPRRARATRAAAYKRIRQRRRDSARLAIRCAYCLRLYCPTCARKHFAPIARAQHAIDRELARVAVHALADLEIHCPDRRPKRKGTSP
jgi:hypothetical protein